MKTNIIIIINILLYSLNFSCRDSGPDDPNPPVSRDSCLVFEPILDSNSNVIVYSIKDSVQNYGYATKVNATTFFNLGSIINNERILIHLYSLDYNGDLSDLLVFYLKQSITGCYEFEVDCNWPIAKQLFHNCSTFETNYGDVLVNSYVLDTSQSDNKIEIITIDTVQRIIEGKFACTFVFPRDRTNLDPGNPDTIRFFNGYFKGTYEEK